MPSTAWPPETNAANEPQAPRARLGRSRSLRSVCGTHMSPHTFPCAHRLPRTHTHRHKSGVALSCGLPFKAVPLMCYYAIPLKGFSHFSSHSRLSLESSFSIATFGCGSSHTPQYAARREVISSHFQKTSPCKLSCGRGGSGVAAWRRSASTRRDVREHAAPALCCASCPSLDCPCRVQAGPQHAES